MRTDPRLERNRKVRILLHHLQQTADLGRILHQLRPRAALGDLLHRTPRVEVQLGKAGGDAGNLSCRHRNVVLVRPEDLTADRPFPRHRLHQMIGRGVSVRQGRSRNHLGISQVSAALLAHQAERCVGETGQRCEDESHSSDFAGAGTGRGVRNGSE